MTAIRLVALSGALFLPHAAGQATADEFLDANGIRIRYRVSGRGPAVVLLHGLGESLESWERAGVVEALSPHFRVIAMDVRGHGRSGKPHGPELYGAELAADVVRLLDHLRVAKGHVVGYSMGALIALDVAALHPEHVRSLVVGGTGSPAPEALSDFRQQAAAFEQGNLPIQEGADGRALATLLRGLGVLDEADVRRIKAPILALIGANDRFMSDVHRLRRAVPGTTIAVIPDANHATAMAHPMFAATLRAWLLKQK